MKISVSKESVVFQGPASEDCIWGEIQFPKIFKNPDGTIAIRTHFGDDTPESWGDEETGDGSQVWCISKDNGITWERTSHAMNSEVGLLLPNGDRIYAPWPKVLIYPEDQMKADRITTATLPSDKPTKQADGSWPYPVFTFKNIWGCRVQIYDVDTLPDEFAKREVTLYRVKKGETHAVEEKALIEQPYMSRWSHIAHGEFTYSSFHFGESDMKLDKEGNLWVSSFTGPHMNPYTGGIDPHTAAVIHKSTDNGKTFQLVSYIPFNLDTTKHPTAHLGVGFWEPVLEFMEDGSMIVLLRTAGVFYGGPEWNPMYLIRSTDGGKTFSEPVEFGVGVKPQICKLGCGITLTAYGRPGIFVRASNDPSGVEWSEPIEIMTADDRSHLMNNPPERPDFHEWVGSCCNVCLEPIDETHALLAYSDFYYPDQSGDSNKKLRTILTRIITVDLD